MLLVTTFQWFELWFKVLRVDLDTLLQDRGATFESTKLLRRGCELYKLFELQLEFDEATIVRELALTKTLRSPQGLGFSDHSSQIGRAARHLPGLARRAGPSLHDAIREYLAQLTFFRARFSKFMRATLVPKRSGAPSYAGWLALPRLLDLQQGVKAGWAEAGQAPATIMQPEHITADENMFIVVHQCFELWFQVMLDQIDRAIPLIIDGAIAPATQLLRHVADILRLLVRQIQIPATMLPLDFARFREEQREQHGKILKRGLSPASGTESYQFREIEIACGLRDDAVFRDYLNGTERLPIRLLTPRQRERLKRPTLGDAFDLALRRRGIEAVDSIFTPANVRNANADLAELADTLLDLDEAFHFWRVGHVSMVEKMIGGKSGTGFLGPEYLMETAGIKLQEKNRIFENKQVRPRFFEELWQVRTRLGTIQP